MLLCYDQFISKSKSRAMKKILLLTLMSLMGLASWGQTNSFPTTGNAEIKSGNLLIETNVHRSSLLTLKDTHYSSDILYKFQIESDGLKIRQDDNINYNFKSGGDFTVNNGNVGIGTTSPSSLLDIANLNAINGESVIFNFTLKGAKSSIRSTLMHATNNVSNLSFYTDPDGAPELERMRITSTGDVGIGTITPGGYNTNSLFQIFNSDDIVFDVQGGANQGWISTGSSVDNDVLGGIAFTKQNGQSDAHRQVAYIRVKTEQSTSNTPMSTLEIATKGSASMGDPDLVIVPSGNVGIGTVDPLSKLAVDGQIRATEVKVLADISVPDYVFEPGYDLRTLKEIEEYIKENKHLPEIPSAAEIGENGIDLGDMNMRLLKKIEELTLYQIQLLEKLEHQNEQIEKLKTSDARLDELEKKIELLEKE